MRTVLGLFVCLLLASSVAAYADCTGNGGDADLDTVGDDVDNCPSLANADQADADEDNIGDVCDTDVEGTLVITEARIRVESYPGYRNGRAHIRTQIADLSGTLRTDLLTGAVRIDVTASGGEFALSRQIGAATAVPCVLRNTPTGAAGTITCFDPERVTKVLFFQSRRDPRYFAMRFTTGHLDNSETGLGRPSGPVHVEIHHGAGFVRTDDMLASRCKPRGPLAMSCKRRTRGNATISSLSRDSLDPSVIDDETAEQSAQSRVVTPTPTITPAPIKIDSILSYGGSGCPLGSLGQSFSNNRSAVNFLFDSFVASSGPLVPASEASKVCVLVLDLRIPEGLTVVEGAFTYRGYKRFSSTQPWSTQRTGYTFQGESTEVSSTTYFSPSAGDYVLRDNLLFVTYAPLGELRRRLFIGSEVVLGAPSGQITTDSLDVTFRTLVQMTWKKKAACTGPACKF